MKNRDKIGVILILLVITFWIEYGLLTIPATLASIVYFTYLAIQSVNDD